MIHPIEPRCIKGIDIDLLTVCDISLTDISAIKRIYGFFHVSRTYALSHASVVVWFAYCDGLMTARVAKLPARRMNPHPSPCPMLSSLAMDCTCPLCTCLLNSLPTRTHKSLSARTHNPSQR